MSNPVDVERALDAYLAADGLRVPDRVLDAALDLIDDTPQARRGLLAPRRFRQMNTFARAAAVLVVAVGAVAALAVIVSPGRGIGTPNATTSPSPSTTPSAAPSDPPLPALDATFVSPAYGFKIRFPSSWIVTPAVDQWFVGTNFGPGDSRADEIVAPAGLTRARISIASLALPSGMTMQEFRAFASPYSSPFQPDPCPALAPLPGPLTLNEIAGPDASPQKVTAVISINGCAALAELGGSVYDIDVIAGGRGYDLVVDGHISPADVMAWLSTVVLEPASAPTATAAASPSGSK